MSQPRLSERQLTEALTSIAHRGPDATTTWFSSDRRTALGHVRLSIIGLENGTQPIADETGRVRTVVNGELYGYQRQRDELKQRGHRFSTESDSEVALHLYLEHGIDFVQRLRGEFAIVMADSRNDSMVAVRDRFGIKPLFYTVHNGEVLFASEIKALLALGVPARWNSQGYAQEMFMLRPHNDTLFKGIHAVPPGHYAVARDGEVSLHRYWDTDYPSADELAVDDRSDAEIVEGFRSVLKDAMAERLVADVEVASYLSGGIDSCAVLGLARELTDQPIRAFTITFDESPAFNEAQLAEEQAALSGASFNTVPVGQQDIVDSYSDAVWHAETIFVNGHGVAKYRLSEAVRDAGIKVVFTGEGADELLGGYPPFRQDLLKHNTEGQDPAEVERMLKALADSQAMQILIAGETPEQLSPVETAIGFVPSWMSAFARPGLSTTELLRRDFIDAASPDKALDLAFEDLLNMPKLQGRDAVNQSLYLWTKTLLPNFVLTFLSDRMEMAHSVEGRVPFLDHHVAEYVAAIPIHHKIRGMREKHVLREAVKDVVIEPVYNREKHPFTTPPAVNNDDPMFGFVHEVVNDPSFASQPVFDPAAVNRFLAEVEDMDAEGRGMADAVIQRVLSTTLLNQRFGMTDIA